MANTVNDVMNVIASPDYGIKNIAGTNQEILAILQGAHNSKNNIHALVNDIKNILQELVEITTKTKKKTIEIGGGNSTKINSRHIKDILDETKGIRKAIDNLAKSIKKNSGQSPAVAKLSDKASEMVADAMVKDMKKQNKNGRLSSIINSFSKLKDISLKDLLFGKKKMKLITGMFKDIEKDLNINKKDLDSVIKLISSSPEIINSLNKIGRKVNKIIKNNTIEKLSDILIGNKKSLLSISIVIQKNKKIFENASKASKSILDLTSNLNKSIFKLLIASLFAKSVDKGFKNIETIVNKLITLSKKLTKNKKDINEAAKVAKKITALSGQLLITSIFLSITAITGIPAILGAIFLSEIVDRIIPVAKKLSKNKKHISNAVGSALILTAFTGLMAISSLLLATIAITGIPALLGSIIVLGIIKINTYACKTISKSLTTIILGSIGMAIMSGALILFGIALQKITDATKGVSFKQVGVIAALTIVLGASIAILGIPALFPFILLGSISVAIMGFALRPFAKTLAILSKATKKLKMTDILFVTGSLMALGLGISAMAVLLIPVALGAVTVRMMNNVLYKFVKSLKILSDMGEVPTKLVDQALKALGKVGDFFRGTSLSFKSIIVARRFKKILRPFGNSIIYLSKLKELGSIPTSLVNQTLKAIGSIGQFYMDNPVDSDAIKEARRYKWILRPFGNSIQYLAKLKELGGIPMSLVNQTLKAMGKIAQYYMDNPIERQVIREARKYKRMLRPFGKTLDHLAKLKELGSIPMSLVNQTLKAMTKIAKYYMDNPLERKAIREARKYKRMLRPFGKTISHLSKLKNLGSIPTSLVNQTLKVMSKIAQYYMDNPLERKAIREARKYKRMLRPFGKTIESLVKLKELEKIPTKLVDDILTTMFRISLFYSIVILPDDIEEKSEITGEAVEHFTDMAQGIYDKFSGVKEINAKGVLSVVLACKYIMSFYRTRFFVTKNKMIRMNTAVRLFIESTKYLKDSIQDFTKREYVNVLFAVISMKEIVRFLKFNSFSHRNKIKAFETMFILKRMTSILLILSKINPLNISSVGTSIKNTINGINEVDIDKVKEVTNMFNAFNSINKSENIINKFTESIKLFTETCKNLMDAMTNNTNAINNMDSIGINGSVTNEINQTNIIEKSSSNNNETNNNNGIRIINVDEIAKTIADKINGALSVDVADTQVQLLINGTGGNEWTITKY